MRTPVHRKAHNCHSYITALSLPSNTEADLFLMERLQWIIYQNSKRTPHAVNANNS